MTKSQIKAWLAKLEAELHPTAIEYVLFWDDEELPPDCTEAIRLRWPDDLQNSAVSGASLPRLPKPG